jgi:hypothetical protein
MNSKVTAWRASIATQRADERQRLAQLEEADYAKWMKLATAAIELATKNGSECAIIGERTQMNKRALNELKDSFKVRSYKQKVARTEIRQVKLPRPYIGTRSVGAEVVAYVETHYVITLR